MVATKGSLSLRPVSRSPIAGELTMKGERNSLAERYEIFTRVAAVMTDKARKACAKRLSPGYDLLGEDVAQADVESFLDAQVEALLTPDPER